MQIIYILSLLTLVDLQIFANQKECIVDDRIMYSIATIERHRKTPVGYPYLISINSKKDQKSARKIAELSDYFLDRRTLDCIDSQTCTSILDILNKKGIKNLDLGGFQINQMFWKMNKSAYFDIRKSYKKACEIIMANNKIEWSWENIAKYHSKTKKYNESYKRVLMASIRRNENE